MDKLLKCQEELQRISEYTNELENHIAIKSQEIEYHKKHDVVTGFLNNFALTTKLKENKNSCYFLLNVDNFSNINDAYGYEIGNEALKEIAKLLKIIKPPHCEIYRFCADKFVFLGSEEKSVEELELIADEILSFFNASNIMIDDDIPIQISFSIGISKAKGIPAISQAELALKEIRNSRRNYYFIYNQELENLETQQENVYWINKIRESILEEEMIVHFQPIMNNHTKKIEKYECLSRINDEGELVSPFRFMEAASATRVLHLMTQSVILQACKKFTQTEYEFSINITKDDLFMGYLESFLLKNCIKYEIDPSRVVLEILEDISTLNEKNIIEQLESLRFNGFAIAIDDFGAQNSNFSRLLEFKPDYLKIDGAFIKNIVTDKSSRLITESITHICKVSDIKVIAEYIHNKEVLDAIVEIGIDYSQGYYIGAPSTELI